MQCINAIKYYEKKYQIPYNLLSSISIVESGRWNEKSKRFYPWPWAVNVEGKPYFFDTKSEAVSFVKNQLQKGIKSIDVGCNQINLLHHGENFVSVDQAFNPIYNSNYAAKFLKSHFTQTNSWIAAVARYHSQTPHLGQAYANKVLKTWKKHGNIESDSTLLAMDVPKDKKQHFAARKHLPTAARSKPKIQNRYKEGIIVFTRNVERTLPVRKDEKTVVEISERMLQQY